MSIFDKFSTEDVILAFFPCTRFENQIMLSFRGQANQMKTWTQKQKIEYDMNLMKELERNYLLVCKMFVVCLDKGLKLIMENPYSEEHFLRRYWCIPATIIDKDRRDNGDYYKKPTQYWFLGIEPKINFLLEPLTYNNIEYHGKDAWKSRRMKDYSQTGAKDIKTARSMIHPQYANRFIRQYIIDESEAEA